jgi:hypothetical protein
MSHVTERLAGTRAVLSLAGLGVLLLLIAVLFMQWPGPAAENVGGARFTIPMPYFNRLSSYANQGEGGAAARDGLLYVIVLGALVGVVVAWRRGSWRALAGLTAVGVVGLSFISGLNEGRAALFTGPMVGVCGFSLVAVGGLVAFASIPGQDDTEADQSTSADAEDRTDGTNAVPTT